MSQISDLCLWHKINVSHITGGLLYTAVIRTFVPLFSKKIFILNKTQN